MSKLASDLGLSMLMLSDVDLAVTKRYGVLNEEAGNLPHPTALVVDRGGVIRFAQVDRDYRIRPENATLLAAIAALRPRAAGPPSRPSVSDPGTLVVLNKAEATASLIDLPTGEVVATLPTAEGPHEVAISADGKTAVVTNYGTRENPGSSLTVLDVPAARVVRTIDLGEDRRPHGIRWLPGNREVVVTVEDSQAILTVDVATGQVTRRVETGQEVSHMVVVTPDGKKAFVANIGSGSVTAIDLKGQRRLENIPTGEGAEGIALTPDGKEVWVTNRSEDTVTVLDARTLDVIEEVPSSSFPIRAAVTPDGRHVLVSNARSGDVAVFDARRKTEVRRIPMELTAEVTEGRLFGGRFGDSSVPIGILIHPNGRRAYVANANADVISVLDLEAWTPVGYLTAGKEPDGLGYTSQRVRAGAGQAAPGT